MNTPPVASLEDRIRASFSDLPPNEQRLAETILSFPGDMASYSAAELAKLANVSPATASRFFKRIGYKSFAEARQDVRAAQRWGVPFYMQTRQAEGRGVLETLRQHLDFETANLNHTFQQMSEEDLLGAVSALEGAARIKCLGFRTSAMVAGYAAWLLAQLRGNVSVIGKGSDTLSEHLVALGPGDLVLAVGLRRRLPVFARSLKAARERGAKVLLITEPTAQSAVQHADIVLRVDVRSASLFDSDATAYSLVHLVSILLASRLGKAGRDRMRAISDLHTELGEF
ncbi:MurR/RpiR family transcriptional regulator [Acidimangrovimonas sediminis]|uniref:MurR/RpiR family transcriptional regulator n=1 Tax=Acidimangrovimonas sediminis TaxID=2056283 RepID=UPI001304DB90|nr:MurR/RpiR family transcriptional regulator [Acidimangrovimonas sediminis]